MHPASRHNARTEMKHLSAAVERHDTMNIRSGLRLLSKSDEQLQANWGLWIAQAAFIAAIAGTIKYFFPASIPFEFFELWSTKGSVSDWLVASWPILLWAVSVTLIASAVTRNSRIENIHAETFLERGLWVSLRAGVMEEIVFRWLLFMTGIVGAKVGDWLLGGFFFDHGLVWVIYTYILAPIADFTSLGLLHDVLGGGAPWFIAAGVIIANRQFRDGHKYLGWVGFINSWFIGLYFFYLTFTFGLVAAIVVHVTYDALIFLIRYIDRVIERARNVDNGRSGENE